MYIVQIYHLMVAYPPLNGQFIYRVVGDCGSVINEERRPIYPIQHDPFLEKGVITAKRLK